MKKKKEKDKWKEKGRMRDKEKAKDNGGKSKLPGDLLSNWDVEKKGYNKLDKKKKEPNSSPLFNVKKCI